MPAALAAAMSRVPLLVHEQNAVFGRANRLTARFARAVALSFEPTSDMPAHPGQRRLLTGNPTRPEFARVAAAPARRNRFRVLVLGGSQGARVFSDVVPAAVALLPGGAAAAARIWRSSAARRTSSGFAPPTRRLA